MPNPLKTEVLETWTTLKTKFLTTLTNLKANHKDNWALVKPPSGSRKVFFGRSNHPPGTPFQHLANKLAQIKALLAANELEKLRNWFARGEI